MDEIIKKTSNEISRLVAFPPIIYLLAFLVGSIAHFFKPIIITTGKTASYFGFIVMLLAPLLIFWAQASLRKFKKGTTGQFEVNFDHGPYRFTRNPTYMGLNMLILGFGFMANSFFIVLSGVISFLFLNFNILRKEEKLLESKYGEAYEEYQKKVRRWL